MIYLVSTPLQLINAIEARHHFGSAPGITGHCLFIANLKYNTQVQLQGMLSMSEWDSVAFLFRMKRREYAGAGLFIHHLLLPFKERAAAQRVIKSLKRQNNDNGTLFLGNYAGRLFYRVARHFSGKIVLLDDGAGTREIYNLRKAEQESGLPHFFSRALSLKKRAGLIAAGIGKSGIPGNVSFFSCFLNGIDDPAVVRNDYSFISALAGSKPVRNIVYFAGSPLVELGVLDIREFLNVIIGIRNFYSGKGLELVYILHRLERKSRSLLEREGIIIRSINIPLEAALLQEEALPVILASFYSSALLTTHVIFKRHLEINAFDITSLKLKKTDMQQLKSIYDYFRQFDPSVFRVLGLP